jgi:hypothetical protein
MPALFSRYTSGAQLPAGTIVGSISGVSGLNPIVDRLNSISTENNLIVGSIVSGASTRIYTGAHVGSPVAMVVNVAFGTGSPPNAGSVPNGTLFIKYLA